MMLRCYPEEGREGVGAITLCDAVLLFASSEDILQRNTVFESLFSKGN